jgi:hypothetical protein
MSEREEVLQEFGNEVVVHDLDGEPSGYAWRVNADAMADEIVRLRAEKRNNVACVKWIAAAFCDEFGNPRGDMPQWAHAVTDTLLLGLTPADAVIRALTPRARAMTREEAYDMIDRYLRAVMHDRDYADYSAALDVILTPPPAPRVVVTEAMVAAALFVSAAIDSHCHAQWWQDSDMQDELEKHGLLESVTVDEPCGGPECECERGDPCLRVTPLARELRALTAALTEAPADA